MGLRWRDEGGERNEMLPFIRVEGYRGRRSGAEGFVAGVVHSRETTREKGGNGPEWW